MSECIFVGRLGLVVTLFYCNFSEYHILLNISPLFPRKKLTFSENMLQYAGDVVTRGQVVIMEPAIKKPIISEKQLINERIKKRM